MRRGVFPLEERLYGLAREKETRDGGNEGKAARDYPLPDSTGLNLLALPDPRRLFTGIEHPEGAQAPPFHLVAHDPRQGAYRGLGNVGELEPGGVALVSRSHGTKDRRSRDLAPLDKQKLRGHRVDAIKNEIKGGKIEGFCGFPAEYPGEGFHPRLRIDIPNSLGGDLGLGPAYRGMGREKLSVKVREGNGIRVHQEKRTDPGAGEGLHGVGANPSQAEHRDP